MYLPLFIALLLGFINPGTTNTACNGGGTVYVHTTNSGDDPDDGGEDDGEEDDGEDGPGNGTGGDTTHNPPPKP